jgi:hypothetical protein
MQHNQIKSNLVKFNNMIKFQIESNSTVKLNFKFCPNLVKFKVKLEKILSGNQGGRLRVEAGVGAESAAAKKFETYSVLCVRREKREGNKLSV